MKGAVGAIAVVASVWLFGGLRDFRWDRGQSLALARDTVLPATDTTRRTEPTASIAPINQGAAASAGVKPRPRRPAPPQPSAPASLSISPHDPVRAGDTATLTAVVLDGKGEPMSDSGVTRTSSEPELAAVDSTTGPSDTSGYVPLNAELGREEPQQETGSASPALPPAAPPPPNRPLAGPREADAPVDRRQLESRIREGVEDCYGALRSKDLDRLAEMYRPKTYADEEKLKRLTRILRTEPWKAVVGKRVDGAREMGIKAAAAEFSFRLVWRDALGGRLSSQPIFRAEFARDPDGWAMSSCRIVGSPKL